MEVTTCPGCLGEDFAIAPGEGSSFAATAGVRSFAQPVYEIRICRRCGLYFKSHIVSPAELAEYYECVDFSKWDIGELFPSEKAILRVITQLPGGKCVLDYGCSDGRLFNTLPDRYKRFGYEINRVAARHAEAKGITMLAAEQLENGSPLRFDAIVLSDIFEHLINPTEILRQLRQRLNSQGLLILLTGDGDADACRRDIANFWYFRTLEHVCMLNKKHAEYLAGELDLRLIEWTPMSHYDCGVRETARQRVQDFVYWQFRNKGSALLTSLLKLTPVLRRAQNWPTPPAITCTKDHVLAVFQNQN